MLWLLPAIALLVSTRKSLSDGIEPYLVPTIVFAWQAALSLLYVVERANFLTSN